ncbi:hypothetical protein LCGC14_2858370 [marine sediment metagenome]|uniref:Uncharacterized protein n=1 Tax=marine sediment metagenome TaxID=412755 RepID=A0A0F9AEU0_9ZZZZ
MTNLLREAFNEGYGQALELATAHWPQGFRCDCDPPLSQPECNYFCYILDLTGKYPPITTDPILRKSIPARIAQ